MYIEKYSLNEDYVNQFDMSYGSQFNDDYDRYSDDKYAEIEDRLNKKRGKSKRRANKRIHGRRGFNKKLISWLLIIAFAMGLIFGAKMLWEVAFQKVSYYLGYETEKAVGNYKDTGVLVDNTKKPWNLVLVNKWNPIKDDQLDQVDTISLSNGEKVDKRIYKDLQAMFDQMRREGIYPVVGSGYRTSGEQEALMKEKRRDLQRQGMNYFSAKKEAEKWVAKVGYSEHQLGLAVDINADKSKSTGGQVYSWLDKNAYRYGFVKRYPDDKTRITGVNNEPWHYRYVGLKPAKVMYDKNYCLEEYLSLPR